MNYMKISKKEIDLIKIRVINRMNRNLNIEIMPHLASQRSKYDRVHVDHCTNTSSHSISIGHSGIDKVHGVIKES